MKHISIDQAIRKKQPADQGITPEPLIYPLDDIKSLVRRISEASGCSLEEATRRFVQECESPGFNVTSAMRERKIAPNTWSDELASFYAETDSFLYETAVWNRTRLKNNLRRWIATYLAASANASPRILVYGDGMGFDSAYFSQCGSAVDYFEVSQRAIRFARRLFDDLGVTVQIITDENQIMLDTYDAIVCLDVLEHVPTPPLLVSRLAKSLKPGGKLVVSAPFFVVTERLGTHLRSNRAYAGDLRRLYSPHGLKAVDGRFFWNPIVLEKYHLNSSEKTPTLSKVRLGGIFLRSCRSTMIPFILVGLPILPLIAYWIIQRRRELRRVKSILNPRL